MSATLPSAGTPQAWDALLANDAALFAGVKTIAQRHGLGSAAVARYDSGSLPVYALGDRHVLKLYPPDDAGHAAVEARTLAFVHGALPLPTPEVVATGTLDGWQYLLMSQLRGRRLVDAWPDLHAGDRDRLADDLGHSIAVLHGLDAAPVADLAPHWEDFVTGQRDSAVDRQRTRRLDSHWLEQIAGFLDAWMPPAHGARSLLHTEIMREHLLVEPGDKGWQLSGVFDFEPAMVGDPEYDFASVGLFVSCGDGRFLRRVLRAYGYRDAALDEALQCRLMAHAILHRYSNLRWYLERLPPQRATTLAQLAQQWWCVSEAPGPQENRS